MASGHDRHSRNRDYTDRCHRQVREVKDVPRRRLGFDRRAPGQWLKDEVMPLFHLSIAGVHSEISHCALKMKGVFVRAERRKTDRFGLLPQELREQYSARFR